MGTNWINKCWSVENFAKLSDLLSQYKIKVVLIGFGKNDEQKAQAIMNLARANNIVNFVGKTSLMQTARIIKLAKAVIAKIKWNH